MKNSLIIKKGSKLMDYNFFSIISSKLEDNKIKSICLLKDKQWRLSTARDCFRWELNSHRLGYAHAATRSGVGLDTGSRHSFGSRHSNRPTCIVLA